MVNCSDFLDKKHHQSLFNQIDSVFV